MIEEAETLLRRLHTQGVEFVIIGGICNVLHGQCQMLSLDALIRSKEALGREQDLAALRQLRAIRERSAP